MMAPALFHLALVHTSLPHVTLGTLGREVPKLGEGSVKALALFYLALVHTSLLL